MSEPSFKNACDYHIVQPSSLATFAQTATAALSADCRACSVECSLQRFGKADRAECLQSCDPSPVKVGEGATDGAQYPDPLSGSQFDDIRDTYIPRVTALTCPSSSCSDGTSETEASCTAAGAVWTAVNDNDGRFAGSVKCRPFTEKMQKDVLAAAASAVDGCGVMKGRGFSCDLDCDILERDECMGESSQFCKWTIPQGGSPDDGYCSTRTMESAKAINMCSTAEEDACAEGSAMLVNTEGEACTVSGKGGDKGGVYGFDDKSLFRCIADQTTQLVRLNACPNNEPFC